MRMSAGLIDGAHGALRAGAAADHAVGRLIPSTTRPNFRSFFLTCHDFLKKIIDFLKKIKRERLICDRFHGPNRAYLSNI